MEKGVHGSAVAEFVGTSDKQNEAVAAGTGSKASQTVHTLQILVSYTRQRKELQAERLQKADRSALGSPS